MKVRAFCGIILFVFIHCVVCHLNNLRTKRGYPPNLYMVLNELQEIDDELGETKDEIIDHIHQYVEPKLDHQEDILTQLLRNQKLLMFCRLDGNPCQNGGSCDMNEDMDSHICLCPDGWTGTNCEEPMDPCSDVYCLNNGTCEDGFCTCHRLYYGDHCEHERPDPCIDVQCQNGGSCYESFGQAICHCLHPYTGIFCETDLGETCKDVMCQHGGTCYAGRCFCTELYKGEFCEKGVCDEKLESYNALAFPMPGEEMPICDPDGSFGPYQYTGSQAGCVTKAGRFLPYSMDRWEDEHVHMDCQCARDEFRAFGPDYNPVNAGLGCLPNGSYNTTA